MGKRKNDEVRSYKAEVLALLFVVSLIVLSQVPSALSRLIVASRSIPQVMCLGITEEELVAKIQPLVPSSTFVGTPEDFDSGCQVGYVQVYYWDDDDSWSAVYFFRRYGGEVVLSQPRYLHAAYRLYPLGAINIGRIWIFGYKDNNLCTSTIAFLVNPR